MDILRAKRAAIKIDYQLTSKNWMISLCFLRTFIVAIFFIASTHKMHTNCRIFDCILSLLVCRTASENDRRGKNEIWKYKNSHMAHKIFEFYSSIWKTLTLSLFMCVRTLLSLSFPLQLVIKSILISLLLFFCFSFVTIHKNVDKFVMVW